MSELLLAEFIKKLSVNNDKILKDDYIQSYLLDIEGSKPSEGYNEYVILNSNSKAFTKLLTDGHINIKDLNKSNMKLIDFDMLYTDEEEFNNLLFKRLIKLGFDDELKINNSINCSIYHKYCIDNNLKTLGVSEDLDVEYIINCDSIVRANLKLTFDGWTKFELFEQNQELRSLMFRKIKESIDFLDDQCYLELIQKLICKFGFEFLEILANDKEYIKKLVSLLIDYEYFFDGMKGYKFTHVLFISEVVKHITDYTDYINIESIYYILNQCYSGFDESPLLFEFCTNYQKYMNWYANDFENARAVKDFRTKKDFPIIPKSLTIDDIIERYNIKGGIYETTLKSLDDVEGNEDKIIDFIVEKLNPKTFDKFCLDFNSSNDFLRKFTSVEHRVRLANHTLNVIPHWY